jgi:hypothetical protein
MECIMERQSKLYDKIDELKQLMIQELGEAGKEVGSHGDLSIDLTDDERIRFWLALERAGHKCDKLYKKRSWKQFWQMITGSPAYVPARAVHVRPGSATLERIARQNLDFNFADYRKGLWPPEAIEARVIAILAESCNVPAYTITRETKLTKLTEC